MTATTTPPAPIAPKPDARATLGAQAGKAAFWNTVLMPAKLVSHLIALLVLSNAESSAAYGVYVIALAVSSTSGAFVDLGTERSVVKFLPEAAGREGARGVRRLIGWVFGFKMAIILPILVIATVLHGRFFAYVDGRVKPLAADKVQDATAIREHDQVAALVSREHWTIFGVVIAIVLVGAFYDVAMQSLVATFRNKSWNLITIAVQVIDPLVVSTVVLIGGNIAQVLVARVFTDFLALLLAGTVAMIAIRKSVDEDQVHIVESERGIPVPLHRFARYSALQYALQVTSFITSYSFAAIILKSAVDAAGYRTAAGSVTAVLQALLVPIVGLQVPIFTRIFTRKDEQQLGAAYSLVTRFLALVLIPTAVGMAVLGPNLFRILFPKYLAFTPVFIALALLNFTDSCLSTGATILLTFERYKPVIFKSLIGFMAVPLLFVTVPRFGPLGAAITSGGCLVLADLVGTIFATTLLPIRYPLDFLRRVIPAALAMGATLAVLAYTIGRVPADAGGGLHRLVWLVAQGIIAAIGAVVYLVVFRLRGGIAREDRERLQTLKVPLVSVIVRLLGGSAAR